MIDKITISIGSNRADTHWPFRAMSWAEFSSRCANPRIGRETMDEYLAMDRDTQTKLKDAGGFCGAVFKNNRRKKANVTQRTCITLDLDDIDVSTDEVLKKLDVGLQMIVYSTRKHTPEHPRLRIVIPLAEPAPVDVYEPATRMLCKNLGILQWCDPTTFATERMFFWPTRCSDGAWCFHEFSGEAANLYKLCSQYAEAGLNWSNCDDWPRVPGEAERLPQLENDTKSTGGTGGTAEDPLKKRGIIGAFCRAHYPIDKAIDEILPEYYRRGSGGRFSFIGGQTSNGVRIYDGRYAMSEHAHDPARGLHNIFDLCRIHMFGDTDTATSKMMQYAADDPATKTELRREALADFDGMIVPEEDEKPDREQKNEQEGTSAWIDDLDVNPKTGKFESTSKNVSIILRNDPNIKGLIRYDSFRGRIILTRKTPWNTGVDTREWSDVDDSGLRCYLDTVYHIKGESMINDCVNCERNNNKFHPIREYLESLPPWDGKKRAATLIHDFLGCEDSVINRTMCATILYAAIARIYKPGSKFDNLLVLAGPEGIGKSTLLRKLGREWYSDSVNPTEKKEFFEGLLGTWIFEWGELSAARHADDETVKANLSRTEDAMRPAYGRNVEYRPRQCVGFGTTNDDRFLKGLNGNRRFWIVPVSGGAQLSVFDDFDDEYVGQVWAEVLAEYRRNPRRPLCLPKHIEDEARERNKAYNQDMELEAEIKAQLLAYLDTHLPKAWKTWTAQQRRDWYLHPDDFNVGVDVRGRFCIPEFLFEVYGKRTVDPDYKYLQQRVSRIADNLPGWEKVTKTIHIGGGYGKQKCYERIVDVVDR